MDWESVRCKNEGSHEVGSLDVGVWMWEFGCGSLDVGVRVLCRVQNACYLSRILLVGRNWVISWWYGGECLQKSFQSGDVRLWRGYAPIRHASERDQGSGPERWS
ncbi:hypothetical protein [Rubritalea tangerina]|uniref:hypothetical protein n=1 Tax=Rubritalea tangerina TaxID=430798 RepID=UPI0036196ACC